MMLVCEFSISHILPSFFFSFVCFNYFSLTSLTSTPYPLLLSPPPSFLFLPPPPFSFPLSLISYDMHADSTVRLEATHRWSSSCLSMQPSMQQRSTCSWLVLSSGPTLNSGRGSCGDMPHLYQHAVPLQAAGGTPITSSICQSDCTCTYVKK